MPLILIARLRFVLLLFYFLLSLLLEKEKGAPGQNPVVFGLTFFTPGLLSRPFWCAVPQRLRVSFGACGFHGRLGGRLGTADETHYDAGGTPNFELSSRDERVPYGRGPSFVLSYALCTFEKRARGLPYPSSRRA